MTYVEIQKEYDFTTEFPTWIIAYCVDTDSWFCTNQRFFYYEYPEEFQCENDAINYFENNVSEFVNLNNEMHPRTTNKAFLENTMKEYRQILLVVMI